MMRCMFAGALALLGFGAFAAPAAAYEYPICMNYVAGRMGAVERCEFMTVEQCRVASLGLQGSCAPNWRYVPPERAQRRMRYRNQ